MESDRLSARVDMGAVLLLEASEGRLDGGRGAPIESLPAFPSSRPGANVTPAAATSELRQEAGTKEAGGGIRMHIRHSRGENIAFWVEKVGANRRAKAV